MFNRIKSILFIFTIILVFLILSQPILANETDLVYRIPITGEIDNGLYRFIERGIDEAENLGADLIVFEIDTYGGYVDPAIKIRDTILQTNVSNATYVTGRAWSAGALIALAGETLIMADGSSMGAAETRPREEKYISAVRKEFKATAEARGRNPDTAAAMVDSDIEIEGIIDKGKLLTLTADEAVEQNMADYRAANVLQVYSELDYSPGKIEVLEMTAGEKAARLITRPHITSILVTIGIIALIAEIFIVGFGISGTIGFLSLALVFSSHIYYGSASWSLAVLFIVGIILLAVEFLLIPGFGVTGIGGIIAVFTSVFLLFPSIEVAVRAVSAIIIATFFAIVILVKIFGSSRLGKNISLEESQTKESGYLAQSDKKDLSGKTGKAVTPLRPAGTAEIEGDRIDVVSEGDFIKKGEKLKVIKTVGNRVIVKKVKD